MEHQTVSLPRVMVAAPCQLQREDISDLRAASGRPEPGSGPLCLQMRPGLY